jgi:L-histidine Nalpha-methyltransferase
MSEGYRILTPADLVSSRRVRDFAIEVLVGLSETPKRLPSRFIYDDLGSELFERICDLEEYYPTRLELSILERYKDEILALVGDGPFNLVDLGAGDGRKTRVLLEHFEAAGADFRYVPIDISEGAMRALVGSLRESLPTLRVEGLVSEYFEGISWLAEQAPERRNLVLFLGSNIGNFSMPQARAMLLRLWEATRDNDLVLIGFDLKKDIEALLAAYNDEQGVTAAFNKNVLGRINRELGGAFDLEAFRHFSTYNVFSGAMESYLVSLSEQTVAIEALRTAFRFKPWEPIHTEYSYKYLVSDVEALAGNVGFAIERHLFDEQRWFLDSIWRVEKERVRR